MKRYSYLLLISLLVSVFVYRSAAADEYPAAASWCLKGDFTECSSTDLSDPNHKRQVIVFPAGYTANDYQLFRENFEDLLTQNSDTRQTPFSEVHKDKILYRGFWLPDGGMDSGDTTFDAAVIDHPIRGLGLTLEQSQVINKVTQLKARDSKLKPLAVIVIFNTVEGDITANASPPNFIDQEFGIAKITRGNLSGSYTGMHELAHAMLGFLDEYVESGFENTDITTYDIWTPFVTADASWVGVESWFGVYSLRISDILADNGNDNISTSKIPSRVLPSEKNEYEHQGGMFFGKGTWHDSGNNLMDSSRSFAHSYSQSEVIKQAFIEPSKAGRPNDRIRNAGPAAWFPKFGGNVKAMIFDADKNHRFHPTTSYDIQLIWTERFWSDHRENDRCTNYLVGYLCLKDRKFEKTVVPIKRYVELDGSKLFGVAKLMQDVICGLGVSSLGTIDVCSMSVEDASISFLPTLKFIVPYQDVGIPADQRLTSYKWRFRTKNGTYTSGWTGWADFTRVF